MAKKNSIISNIFSLGALQGLNYLLPLIILPYLVRVLGVEKFGEIAFAQSFIQYFITLTNYGFQVTASRDISTVRDSPEDVSCVFWSVILVKVALLAISVMIIISLVELLPLFMGKETVIFASALAVVGHVMMPTWFYQGLERMKYILIVNVVARGAMVPLIFLFVVNENDYVLAAALIAFGFTLAGAIGFFVAFRIYPLKVVFPPFDMLIRRVLSGRHVFVASIGHVLYSSTSVAFLLGMLTTSTVVGYFSAAERLVRAVQGMVLPVSQSLYPHIVSLAKNNRVEALRFISISLRWSTLVFFILSLLLYFSAELLVEIVLGAEFKKSVSVVQWMAFIPFVTALGNVLGVQTMLVFGLDKYFSRAYVAAAAINLGALFFLVESFQQNGAAITVFITETFLTFLFIILLKNKGFHFQLFPPSIR